MKEPAPGLSGPAVYLNKFGDTAHFPGTGPQGKSCEACKHFNTAGFKNISSVRGKCRQVAAMRDISIKHVRSIHGSTFACKYFAGKENAGA